MATKIPVSEEIWARYRHARDNGHLVFMRKADTCERFFRGDQWDATDVAALKLANRPALTINKILSTISNVAGEQIYNRNEISFRPINGSPAETAEALRKVFKQISNNNQLDWRRSDMFLDGIITSRGYLDVRMDFSDNMRGEVRISNLNPKNVIPDGDADEYDPDTWNEVWVTKWMTLDDIAVLYGEDKAALLKNQTGGVDGVEYQGSDDSNYRDRFSGNIMFAQAGENGTIIMSTVRNVRVVERQYRILDRRKHFINMTTGDTRPVPAEWNKNHIAEMERLGFEVISKMAKRIRWTVVAGDITLHDEWSPYNHFTVVPYFPYLRHGQTIGLVENLTGPQELLNKVSSQELHVVNTTANSGYKVKTGALANMSVEELEQQGSKTGLVIELNGDLADIEKLTPNATPQGLDRISYKAEEHIKTISNVGDSQQGQDREDVSGKAIQQKRQASSASQAKPMDSLQRTDFILARNILDLIQNFMSEEQIISITHGGISGEHEDITVNQMTPEGTIVNDLTIGEYAVVMTSVPQRETLEDSQFDQAVALKELGIAIPDEVLIESSRLMNKKEIMTKMAQVTESPEAQAQVALQKAMAEAELTKTQAEAGQKQADTALKQAKTQSEGVKAQKEAATPPEGSEGAGGDSAMVKIQADIALERDKFEFEKSIKLKELALKQEELKQKEELARKAQADKMIADRIAAARPEPVNG
jgi:hypothetical protein